MISLNVMTDPLPGRLRDRLGAAFDYLESRLQEEFDLDEAARRSGYSRSQLERLFLLTVGMPATEYVRRRRLSYAAEDLAAGRAVLETALSWGYGSQAAFTRAFARCYGVAPAAYARGTRAGVPPVEAVVAFDPRLPQVDDLRVAPVRVEQPALRLMGMARRGTTRRFQSFRDVPAMWSDWFAAECWRPVGATPWSPIYGLSRVYANGDIDYVVAVDADQGRAPDGYRVVQLPAGPYAVFSAQGPPARTIQALVMAAYGRWCLDHEAQRRAGGWDVEAFRGGPDLPPGEQHCEFRIPLRE